MKKFISMDELPQVEMELFKKIYPCYLTLNLYVLEILNSNAKLITYSYETEEINGEWLLKTKI